MAQFAPVVPLHIASWLQAAHTGKEDLLGGYHLLLAHDVLSDPDAYVYIYGSVRQKFHNSFIIMDNSVVELGKAMKINDLVDACKVLKPDCLVIPDELGNGTATRDMAIAFCKEWAGVAANDPLLSDIELMGVVQGVSVEDCFHTASVYYTLPLIRHIGVPRVLVKQFGTRSVVLHKMIMAPLFDRVHLLGFSDDLLDDVACARMPGVAGIDSAVPIRAGLQEVSLTLDVPHDIGPRGDFWTRKYDLEGAGGAVARANINRFRRWIGSKA